MEEQKRKSKKTRILLAGGHGATTAISVVEELSRRSGRKKAWETHWVGPKYAMEGKKTPTLASFALPKMGVTFHPIYAGKFQKKFTRWTIPSLAKIPAGFVHAFEIVRKVKPDVILSFGGFAAFPVVVAGKIFNIPVVLHEQTTTLGKANQRSIPFANKIAISRPESKNKVPENKSVLTGNPIMSRVASIKAKTRIGNPSTIYITGGSTGAGAMNDLIREIIGKILKENIVIHNTGRLDFDKFKKLKEQLPKSLAKNYEVYDFIDPKMVGSVFARADIIVSRAGANTVSEIIATKRPAILIPLPFSHFDEQKKNAYYAQKWGIAKVMEQETLEPYNLLKEVERTKRNWRKIVKGIKNKKSPDLDASKKLVDLIEKLLD